MADCSGIKIINLDETITTEAGDFLVVVDVSDSNIVKKVEISNLAQALSASSFISTDLTNLLELGADSKITSNASNYISADGGNIISIGTDNKLLVSSVSQSLTEDRVWIGGAGNVAEEKTANELRTFIGLGMHYRNYSIIRNTPTNLVFNGVCRDADDTVDIISGGDINITLPGSPSINTTYHGWIGFDGLSLTGEFSINPDGSDLSNIDGAKRRVFSVFVNSSGEIVDFVDVNINSQRWDVTYISSINRGAYASGSYVERLLHVPDGIPVKPYFSLKAATSANSNIDQTFLQGTGLDDFSDHLVLESRLGGNLDGTFFTKVSEYITRTGSFNIRTNGSQGTTTLTTYGFTEIAED